MVTLPASTARAATPVGAVYAMTNANPGNAVVAYARAADGHLTPLATYLTGGSGTGGLAVPTLTGNPTFDPLFSNNSLRLSDDHHLLFAVNAGAATLSVFRVNPNYSLTSVSTIPVGGHLPVSIATHGHLVYVATDGNAAIKEPAAVTGFRVSMDGHWMAIAGSHRTLDSLTIAQPAHVLFDPSGRHLVVTDLGTTTIDVFPVAMDGRLGMRVDSLSVGIGPFGARFLKNGYLLVSEAQLGLIPSGMGKASVSSYLLTPRGALKVVSPAVGDGRTAACWLTVSRDERYVWASNTADGTISSYTVDAKTGHLTLLNGVAHIQAAMGAPTSGPVDSALSLDGHYLYQLYSGLGLVGGYRVGGDGSLTSMAAGMGMGLPHLGTEGLVAL